MKTRVRSQITRAWKRVSAAVRLSLLAGLMLAVNGAQAAVDTASFPYSMDITFSGYTGSTTLNNFPVLVVLTNGLSGFSYSQMKSPENGGDLRFTDESRTAWLNYEFETWSPFSGSAVSAPTEISGCALWLRSDVGVQTTEFGAVTNWVDQSGNGRHASQTDPNRQPVYSASAFNGQPAVTFDGGDAATGDRLSFGGIPMQTIFIVNRVAAGTIDNAGIIGLGGGYNDKSLRRADSRNWRHVGSDGNDFSNPAGSLFAVNGVNTSVAEPGVCHVLMAQRGGGTYTYDTIGAGFYDNRSFKGDIAEVIVYSRALTTDERIRVGLYLSQKYSLPLGGEPGKSCIWVQVPALSAGSKITAHWGSLDAAQQASTTNGATWSSSYAGVWHALSKTAWAVLPDATAGLFNGANSSAAAVPGVIGNAMNFNRDLGANVNLPVSFLSSVSSAVTVSLWQYGSANLPVNANVFEGTAGGQSMLSSHIPWGDLNVYWDAGTAGSPDRVFKGVTTASEYKGQWNHWAFSKDAATGVMRIFLNGEIWQEGTGKTQSMTGVDAFRLGSAANGGNYYDGIVDEFRVANVAQSPDWIKASFLNQRPSGAFATYGGVHIVQVDPKPYRCSMRIDFPGYTGSEALRNFPALVVFTNGMPDFAFSQFAAANGGDLRFTDADKTTWLNYEIEQWPNVNNSPISPDALTGLALWLKADVGVQTDGSGNVTGWLDQSGNNRTAVQADPNRQPRFTAAAINGLPAVTFDGSVEPYGDRLSFGDVPVQTVFIVNRVGLNTRGLAGIIGEADVDKSIRRESNNAWQHPGNTDTFSNPNGSLFTVNGANTAVAPETVWHVMMAQRAGGSMNFNTLGGGYYNPDSRNYKGDIAEVIVYDHALTPGELTRVGAYLNQRYSLGITVKDSKAFVWVQLPELKANTSIWAYWDNPAATQPAYTTNGATWAKSFAGVWHALNPASVTVLPDSTAGLHSGAGSYAAATTGVIGDAMSFNGSASVDIPAAALASVTNEVTLSLWQYGTGWDGNSIFYGQTAGGARVLNVHLPMGPLYWDAGNSYDRFTQGFASESEWRGQWNNWVFTKNAVTGSMSAYLNGVFWGGNASGCVLPMNDIATFRLGSAIDGVYYTGLIDEFRIQNVAQSPDWIKASYLNQAPNSTFTTYGTIKKQIFGTLIWVQ